MKEYSLAVIDDSPDDCFAITRQLSKDPHHRYRVESFHSLKAGVDALNQADFDLFLVDLDLGGESGMDLLRHARDLAIPKPVVIVTGNDNPAVDMEALDLGATDFINKNEINTQTLSRTIRHAITRKAHEIKLQFAANHDGLTRLAHKHHFEQEFERALARHQRNGNQLALVLLDLNKFKPVNDQHGHQAGDHVLQTVAERLSQWVRGGDLVGRLGGDEFGILLEDIDPSTKLEPLLADIREKIAEPISYSDYHIQITSSAGVATFPNDGHQSSQLFETADGRMYLEKGQRATSTN